MGAAAAKAELERRAEMSLAADDGYGECYAGGFGDYGANAYESDDEADGRKKKEAEDAADGGADTKGPKPGGKAGAGRVPARRGVKPDLKALERERDQKINSELGSLHKMMKEKYGDKADVAFGEGKGGGEGGGGGKRAGEEEDGEGGGGGVRSA